MQIDVFTVLLFGLFLKVVFGALFVVFWSKDRSATWYAWWSATHFLGCFATVAFMLRGVAPDIVSIGLGNSVLLAAFACAWEGSRAFNRREPLLWPIAAIPAIWFGASLVPGVMGSVPIRVILSSALVAPMLGLAAYEFWRSRDEVLPSRWPVTILFASFGLFFALRIPFVRLLPFPFGALPLQEGWLAAFNLVMFAHTVLLTVLMVALTKERLELDQRTKAQTDPLTGALNRRAFMTRGARLLLRHQIDGQPLSLLFLDLDRFKDLNDRYGHSGGDDVLAKFVSVVHDCIRPADFLFRIGGEEFCCLLPNTGTAQAHQVAERIRHRFEAASVDVLGETVRTTVSVGIASSEAFGYDIEMLMRRADMAVYAAKRQGRNRVAVATPERAARAAGSQA